MKHLKQHARVCVSGILLAMSCCVSAMAASGDVAGAVEQTWKDAATQIKTVVDNVVFPALTMVLAIAFFVKLALCYFEYRKHGQFEWTGPAILFVCLIFVILAPNYIWVSSAFKTAHWVLGVMKEYVYLGICSQSHHGRFNGLVLQPGGGLFRGLLCPDRKYGGGTI